jgi:uncharacterized repeat protein (TIGR01451 family)
VARSLSDLSHGDRKRRLRSHLKTFGSGSGSATRTRNARRLRFEPLEDRRLLTSGTLTINEFGLPAPTSGPLSSGVNSITAGLDGNLWFTEQTQILNGVAQPSKIGKITPAGVATEIPIVDSHGIPLSNVFPGGIVAGTSGELWFARGPGGIVEYKPSDGSFTTFTQYTKNADGSSSTTSIGSTTALVVVYDQGLSNLAIYFNDQYNNAIGKLSAVDGSITEYPIEPGVSLAPRALTPFGMAEGPDGNIWFTEQSANKIGRMTLSGAMSEFFIQHSNAQPEGIAAGPDGNLWFTEENSQQIGRITPAGKDAGGAVTIKDDYTLVSGIDLPTGIITGPDHKLWFTEAAGNRIGQLDPSTGAINEFDLPTAAQGPAGITVGPDGNIWFTEAHYTPDPMNPFNGVYNGHIGQAIIPANMNPSVDVEIKDPDTHSPVKPGDPITVHLTVTNTDKNHPVSLTVYDPLPEGFSTSNGDYFQTDGGKLDITKGLATVQIDNLETLGSVHLTLHVTAGAPGNFVNRAYAVSNSPDPIGGNNIVITTVTVQPPNVLAVFGGLLVGDATGDPMTFNTSTNTGTQGKFSWTLTRTGGDSASNLLVKITLPPQLDANSVSPFTDIPGTFDYVDNQHITFHLHPLPYSSSDFPGRDPNSVNFGFTAKPTALGDVSVLASVTANEELNGSANALTKTITTTVEAASTSFALSSSLNANPNPLKYFEKTHVGTTANYTWNLVNRGTTDAANVVVSMTIPATLKNIAAYPPNVFNGIQNADGTTSLTFAFPSMPHGDNEPFGFTAEAAAVGDASVTASVASATPSIKGTVATTIATSVVAAATQLSLIGAMAGDAIGNPMTFDPVNNQEVNPGFFNFHLKNVGGDDPTNVVASITVPASLTNISPYNPDAAAVTREVNGDGSTTLVFKWPSLPKNFLTGKGDGTFGVTAEPTRLGDVLVTAVATADQRIDGLAPITSVHARVVTAATALAIDGSLDGDLMTIDSKTGAATPGKFTWTITNQGGHSASLVSAVVLIPPEFQVPTEVTVDHSGTFKYSDTIGLITVDWPGELNVGQSFSFSIKVPPNKIGPLSLTAVAQIHEPVVGGGYPSKTIETIVLYSDHFHPTYGGGPVIPNVDVVPVFYGKQWKKPGPTDNWVDVSSYPQDLEDFMAQLVKGPYMDFLSYYSTSKQTIGKGKVEDGQIIDANTSDGKAPALLDDGGLFPQVAGIVKDQAQAYENAHHHLPSETNTVFVIYTPPGTIIKDKSGGDSTNSFSGYHTYVEYHSGLFDFQGHRYYYIAMPFNGYANGTTPGLNSFQSMTDTFSHELAEAITDPDGETGWQDYRDSKALNDLTEIGDLASGKYFDKTEGGISEYGTLDGYIVQYEWANTYTYPGTNFTVHDQPVLPRDGFTSRFEIKRVVDPVKKTIGAISVQATGYSFSGLIGTFEDTTNATHDPSNYTATIDWGDATTSTGTVTYDANLNQFLITGSHSFAADAGSTTTVNISVVNSATGDAASLSAEVTLEQTSENAAQLQFDKPAFDAYRNGSSAVITVDRIGDAALAATVDFHVTGGTAVDGTDYQAQAGTLTFAPGATTAAILLPIYANPDATDDLTVNLMLSMPTGNVVLGTQTTTTITIHPSDQVFAPPAPKLAVDSDTGLYVDDAITAFNGSSANPLTFQVTGASVRNGYVQLVDVTDPDDPILLGEAVQAVNGAATITIADNELTDGTHKIAVINSTGLTASARRASQATTIVIDSGAPASQLVGLPVRTKLLDLPVSWSGADTIGGSGLQGFNISVSIDGADATAWLTDTTLTSATFPAMVGHSYAFFSAAVDIAGNNEPTHAIADATVVVTTTPWQNPGTGRALDVTNDGHIVAEDVVTIINYINAKGSGLLPASVLSTNPPRFVDTDGDSNVTASDVITVINFINAHPGLNEAEATAVFPDTESSLAAIETAESTEQPEDDLLLMLAADAAVARRK